MAPVARSVRAPGSVEVTCHSGYVQAAVRPELQLWHWRSQGGQVRINCVETGELAQSVWIYSGGGRRRRQTARGKRRRIPWSGMSPFLLLPTQVEK
jgi:hypothetical protein